jgi:hypothetical protein
MASRSTPLSNLQALFFGTLAVAGLHTLDSVIFYEVHGYTPLRIFQTIASGVLGQAAFNGGLATTLLGGALHVLIALTIVAVYLAASRRWRRLARRPFLYGPLYGLAVYAVMRLVVFPLSALHPIPLTPTILANGVLIHALGVGLPTALIAKATRRGGGSAKR